MSLPVDALRKVGIPLPRLMLRVREASSLPQLMPGEREVNNFSCSVLGRLLHFSNP